MRVVSGLSGAQWRRRSSRPTGLRLARRFGPCAPVYRLNAIRRNADVALRLVLPRCWFVVSLGVKLFPIVPVRETSCTHSCVPTRQHLHCCNTAVSVRVCLFLLTSHLFFNQAPIVVITVCFTLICIIIHTHMSISPSIYYTHIYYPSFGLSCC